MNEEDETLEQDWNVQETDLDGIVNIHGHLFGSADLVQRVCLFLCSYYILISGKL